MVDGHALTRTVGTASPSGIDKPDFHPMGFDIFPEEFRVLPRMQGQKRSAKTGAKGRRGLSNTFFRASHFCGIAIDKVIHGLCGRQFGYRRQHTKCITSQKDDVFRLTASAGLGGIRYLRNRIRRAGIFCQRTIIQINSAGRFIQHHILQNRTEGACGLENLRLLLCRQFDHFGVATPLEIKDAVLTPAMLVIADQGPRCISRQRRLAGTGQTEEHRCAAIVPDVGRGMH